MDQVKHSGDSRLDTNISQELTVQIDGSQDSSIADQPTIAGNPEQSQSLSEILPKIPGYTIEGILGRGGMGVVYQALQRPLNRPVALKMILSGEHAAPEDRLRFLAEAESIARIQHPGIVQLYEFGSHEGHPYFALEYVSGGTLERKLSGTPLPPREAAILVEKLARAMQAAHDLGIVHRDLKPANILLTAGGEPKITDFGLAKTGGSNLTATGAILGTPSYMAPEQADGKKDVGTPTDIYALGAILYECLTGRPPFKAATHLDTILQVVNSEPVSVRNLQITTPRDLETVCHKCLVKEPGKRYGTMGALAEDLRRYLNNEPIEARPVGRVEKAWRWCKRNPAITIMSGTITLVVLAACFIGFVLSYWALGQRDLAIENSNTATKNAEDLLKSNHSMQIAEKEAVKQAYYALLSNVSSSWRSQRFYVTNDRISTITDVSNKHQEIRNSEYDILLALTKSYLWSNQYPSGDNISGALKYSRDGKAIVHAFSNSTITSNKDCNFPCHVYITDSASGAIITDVYLGTSKDNNGNRYQIALDQYGETVAFLEQLDGIYYVSVYSILTRSLIDRVECDTDKDIRRQVYLHLDNSGRRLLIMHGIADMQYNCKMIVRDCITKTTIGTVRVKASVPDFFTGKAIFNPVNPDMVYHLDTSGGLILTDVRNNTHNNIHVLTDIGVEQFTIGGNGTLLAAYGRSKKGIMKVAIVDIYANKMINMIEVSNREGERGIEIDPRFQRVALIHGSGTIYVYDYVTGDRNTVLRGLTGWSSGAAFASSGKYLTAGSSYFQCICWKLDGSNGDYFIRSGYQCEPMVKASFLDNSPYCLLSGSKTAYVLDVNHDHKLYETRFATDTIQAMRLWKNHCSTIIVKNDFDKRSTSVLLYNIELNQIISTIMSSETVYGHVHIDPGSSKIAMIKSINVKLPDSKISESGLQIDFFDIISKSFIKTITIRFDFQSTGTVVKQSSDGRFSIIYSNNNYYIYEIASGSLYSQIKSRLSGFEFPMDMDCNGKHLSVAQSLDVDVYDVISGSYLASGKGHPYFVNGCTIAPDGKRIFSWDSFFSEPNIRIWEFPSMKFISQIDYVPQAITIGNRNGNVIVITSPGSEKLYQNNVINLRYGHNTTNPDNTSVILSRSASDKESDISSLIFPSGNTTLYEQIVNRAAGGNDPISIGIVAMANYRLQKYETVTAKYELMKMADAIAFEMLGPGYNTLLHEYTHLDPLLVSAAAMSYRQLGKPVDAKATMDKYTRCVFEYGNIYLPYLWKIYQEASALCGYKIDNKIFTITGISYSNQHILNLLADREMMPIHVSNPTSDYRGFSLQIQSAPNRGWWLQWQVEQISLADRDKEWRDKGYTQASKCKLHDRYAVIWIKDR